MRRQISSKATIFHKAVTPAAVFVFLVVVLVLVVRAPGMSALGMAVVGLSSALLWVPLVWFAIKLEHVSIDDTFLYISSGGNEEKIRLNTISDVSQTNWIKPYPIMVRLKETSNGRRSILFIPVSRGLSGARRHEIVEELRQLQSGPSSSQPQAN